MTTSKLPGRTRLALYAVVLGIGAQLAPETSMASGLTACLNACGDELRICKRAAMAIPDAAAAADAVVACFDEWALCRVACDP